MTINIPYVYPLYAYFAYILYKNFNLIKLLFFLPFLLLSLSCHFIVFFLQKRYNEIPFQLEKFISFLNISFDEIGRYFLFGNIYILIGIFIIGSLRFYFSKNPHERTLLVILMTITYSQTLLTSILFHNRIDWYAHRFSYLMYFLLPLILFPINDKNKEETILQKLITVTSLIIFLFFIPHFETLNDNGENKENSSIFKLLAKHCKELPIFIIHDPKYMKEETRFHLFPNFEPTFIDNFDSFTIEENTFCLVTCLNGHNQKAKQTISSFLETPNLDYILIDKGRQRIGAHKGISELELYEINIH